MRRLLTMLVLLNVTSGPNWTESASAEDAALAREVEDLAKPWIEAEYVAGLSIGVVRGNSRTTVHLGRADEEGRPVDDATVYEIGSVSKVLGVRLDCR